MTTTTHATTITLPTYNGHSHYHSTCQYCHPSPQMLRPYDIRPTDVVVCNAQPGQHWEACPPLTGTPPFLGDSFTAHGTVITLPRHSPPDPCGDDLDPRTNPATRSQTETGPPDAHHPATRLPHNSPPSRPYRSSQALPRHRRLLVGHPLEPRTTPGSRTDPAHRRKHRWPKTPSRRYISTPRYRAPRSADTMISLPDTVRPKPSAPPTPPTEICNADIDQPHLPPTRSLDPT